MQIQPTSYLGDGTLWEQHSVGAASSREMIAGGFLSRQDVVPTREGWMFQPQKMTGCSTTGEDRIRIVPLIPKSQREFQTRLMEIYAGFLEHTDVQYGKIVDEIERQGLLDNTLIIPWANPGVETVTSFEVIDGFRHLIGWFAFAHLSDS